LCGYRLADDNGYQLEYSDMENNNVHRPAFRRGLAVMLVIGADHRAACVVGAGLSGRPDAGPVFEIDRPEVDSGEFAIELAEELSRDADAGNSGKTVLVLEPEADIMEVALVFEHVVESREPNPPRVGLSDVVVVSSALEIRALFFAGGEEVSDDMDAAEQVACRLEFASIIVLTDLGSRSALTIDTVEVLHFLARISPSARVVSQGDVAALGRAPVHLTPGRAHHLGASMGWQRELAVSAQGIRPTTSPTPASLVSTFVFRDPRPFHPARLRAALEHGLVKDRVGLILRSRGFVRLASRAGRVGLWSTAGNVLRMDPTSMPSWDIESPAGQEIVFFGRDLNFTALVDVLGECLLTADELVSGPKVWQALSDEFPVWDVEHNH
jgi:G3E family GTPase